MIKTLQDHTPRTHMTQLTHCRQSNYTTTNFKAHEKLALINMVLPPQKYGHHKFIFILVLLSVST